MLNDVFEKVGKRYKRAFNNHHDRLYQTIQSKPVQVDGSTYVLVGEKRIIQSPILSHFDVFDERGESVDEAVAQRVHTFIARLSVTEEMRKLRELLRHVVNIQASDITDHLEIKQEADVVSLTENIEATMAKLTSVIERGEQISRKSVLDSDDALALAKDWDAFWKLYEKRMPALIYVYTHNKAPKQHGVVMDLWEEAKFVSTLYHALAPLTDAQDIATIDELITHNYRYGRLRQHDVPLETVGRGEAKLLTFISVIFWVGLFLFSVVILVLVVDGEFSLGDGLRIGGFLLLARLLQKQTKTRLLTKNSAYLTELRARPIKRDRIKSA